MKNKQDIERKVEETLSSLDGIGRAKANPFLFTRVDARLRPAPRNAWEQVIGYISRPAIAMAMLGIVILSNAAVVFWNPAPEEVVTADQPQLALSEEYNLAVSAFYEDENPEP